MTNRKPTKRDHFNALLAIPAVAENADLVAFIEHEIELLDKKNSTERKPTAKQIENEGIKSDILAWIEPDVFYASADVAKNCPACAELSPQRVSALLGQLVASGKLTKTTEKRKNFYSLA
jgi:hypothetical protein